MRAYKVFTLAQDEHYYETLPLECHACAEFSSPFQEARDGTNQSQIHS